MKTRAIIVEPYQRKWKDDFKKIAAEAENALSGLIIRIEHIGSTAVEGLAAKPVIDLDVVIKDYSVFDETVKRLRSIGYIYEGDLGIKEREAFRYENKPHLRKHNLYVCPEYSRELLRHTVFRDYLRSHPDAVRKYGEIKMKAAELYPRDIDKYLKYKSGFILNIYSLCNLQRLPPQSETA